MDGKLKGSPGKRIALSQPHTIKCLPYTVEARPSCQGGISHDLLTLFVVYHCGKMRLGMTLTNSATYSSVRLICKGMYLRPLEVRPYALNRHLV